MIFIISVEDDWTTNEVIDWLIHYNREYFRFNLNKFFAYSLNLQISVKTSFEITFKENGQKIHSDNIKSIWFRRTSRTPDMLPIEIPSSIKSSLTYEYIYSLNAIFNIIQDRFWINKFYSATNDKLETLLIAKSCGLVTPETIITTNKNTLCEFRCKHKDVIMKAIHNVSPFDIDEKHYAVYTSLVSNEMFNAMENTFFPTLFQVYIQKLFEIRCFYLDGEFFSMAIHSQKDEHTSIDFRVYNRQNPNRKTAYTLPVELESKLKILMNRLHLNSGSIDLILTPALEYVFLEVNPVGMFGMTSHPTNSYLERQIAQLLIKNDV